MRLHKLFSMLIALCILTMFAAPAFAGIIYVKPSGTGGGTSWADAANLQNALTTLATSGDEIWVAAGTYKPTTGTNRSISFEMKAGVKIYGGFAGSETARDQRDWVTNTTTLSGNIGGTGNTDNSYHVVTSSSLTTAAVLDGFIISDGSANGVYNLEGGGMYNSNSSPTVINCTFSGNTAGTNGGGMYNYSSNPSVINCTFSGNTSTFDGGGMHNEDNSSPVVTNCTFSGNTAWEGGGMHNEDNSSPIVTNCTFSSNITNTYDGGGMSNENSSPVVTNCIFSGNSAFRYGGGISNKSSSPVLTNCTFSGNSAFIYGGGMYNYSSSKPSVINCILWNNSPNEIYNRSDIVALINYSIVKGGYTGTGNLDANPLFVSPFAPSSAPTTAGNYRLRETSPAIDSGSDAAVPSGITTDMDDNSRITGATVDMGAYEFITPSPLPEISLKQGATEIASGDSYDFGSIDVGSDSGAITFTVENTGNSDLSLRGTPKIVLSGTDATDFSVDEISTTSLLVGSGSTTFTVTFTPSSASVKTALITIANNDSDENLYTVTLNGSTPIFVNAAATGANDGTSWANAYTDLQDALATATSGDGIWVAKGTYKPTTGTDQTISFAMKAGVKIYGGFAGIESALADRDWVTNTTILSGDIGGTGNTDNSYNVVTSEKRLDGTAVLDGFTITGGNANGSYPFNSGGGMRIFNSSPTVTNCTFSGNSANFGGGMYNYKRSPTVTNCIFSGNISSNSSGGGMYNEYGSPVVTNCTFSGNTASTVGGGIYNLGINSDINSSPALTNCTFFGNTASNGGGGIYNSGIESKPSVTNCILWNNSPNEIYNKFSATPAINYSIVKGGYAGTGNLNINPLFIDSSSGNIRLQEGSPAINAGNSAAIPSGIITDLDGNPRIIGTIVDMGAYESAVLPSLPEINVKQGITDIVSGGSYDFGSIDVGNDSGAVTFTVENTDIAVLVLTGTPKIAISGTDAADFSVDETLTTASIAASGNTTFTVTFTPSSIGAKTAVISISNNDSDENPYTVALNGTGTVTPGYASTPVSGSTIDVGTAEIGSSASATLQISETGIAALNITGCTISGTNAADFSVSPSSLTIADGGAAQNITIQCTPSAAGARTATLTVTHNAPGSPATYTLNATGTATPGYASSPVSGSTITLMPTEVGVSTSVILQINETGTAALNITGCTISGANSADFSASPSTFSIADGGAAQNITIQCTPSSAGARTATLTVAHNASGSPAIYTLNCTATESTITPAVTTAEVSGITATEAVSGGNVVYPENCTATLLASGLVWNTVTPAYPADAHTSAGTEPGSFNGTLTGLVPQTTYYVRAYVQYKLNGVVQILYGDTYELTTAPLPGDVNGDKVLDLKDAILALKIVSGAAGNAAINIPADVNGDGKIGMEEAVYVLQNVGIEG